MAPNDKVFYTKYSEIKQIEPEEKNERRKGDITKSIYRAVQEVFFFALFGAAVKMLGH